MTIVLQRRFFFCKNSECEKSKFAERFSFVDDYGRRTKRLNERIIELAANMSALKAEEIVVMDLPKYPTHNSEDVKKDGS